MDDYADLNDEDLAGVVIDAYVGANLDRLNAEDDEEEQEEILAQIESEATDLANSSRETQLAFLLD